MSGTVVFEQETATPSVTPAKGPWNENISVTGFSETIGPVNNVSTTQHGQPYLSGLTDFPGEQIPKETNTGYMSSGQDAGAAHLPYSNSRSLQPRRLTAQYRGISNPERAVGFRRPGFTPKPTLTATAAATETRVTSRPTMSTAMHKERRAFFPPRFQERNVDAKLFSPRHTKKMETGSRQHGPLFPQHERNGQVRFSALPPSRISVIFSQKKLVYEFVIKNQGMNAQPGFKIACVEVPFISIAGINNIHDQIEIPSIVLIESSHPPGIHLDEQEVLESLMRAQCNLKTTVDLSDGQLMTSQYHRQCNNCVEPSGFPATGSSLGVPFEMPAGNLGGPVQYGDGDTPS